MQRQTQAIIEQTVRQEWGHIYAGLVHHLGDFDVAEDALQEALLVALERWPVDGIPNVPRAWLMQTARRKAIDHLRRRSNFESKRADLALLAELEQREEGDMSGEQAIGDERLRLLFTCCHPALAQQARVALTLRTLGGLSTAEVARAFLLPETTLAQRLVRAKRKIKAANIPYKIPDPELWQERLSSVLAVIYLIFNEGHTATRGPLISREDLSAEAIRLCHILTGLIQNEPEVIGLLALMLLHDSRRNARISDEGCYVTLEQQDRQRWDKEKITSGVHNLKKALSTRQPGPYQIQAAISAVHAQASSFAATDWHEIMLLYNKLYELHPSPVVKLNAIVALSFCRGAEVGLDGLAELKKQSDLDSYQPYHAAHADMLRRAGRVRDAIDGYNNAIKFSSNAVEKQFLEQRRRDMLKQRPTS